MKKHSRWLAILVLWTVTGAGRTAPAQDTYREAYDVGYSEGKTAGSTDRESKSPYDYAGKPAYQDGLRGFAARHQDRDVYRVAYRRGFEDGYEVGYGLAPERKSVPSALAVPNEMSSPKTSGREVLTAGTLLRIRLLESLTTERNQAGDEFRAEVVGNVIANNVTVIPSGSPVTGVITQLKRAGRSKGRSERTLKLKEVELPHGSAVPLEASVVGIEEPGEERVERDDGTVAKEAGKGRDAGKISAAAGIGALIGILSGGGRGAAVGAAVGAAAGSVGVLATRGSDLVMPVETELTFRIEQDAVMSTGVLRPPTH